MSEGKKKLSAREYLGQLEELDIKINQDLERLEEMKTDACCPGGIDYSKDRVQTSISGDKLGGQVTRYISFNEYINTEIDRFADAKEHTAFYFAEILSLRDDFLAGVAALIGGDCADQV